MQTQNPQPQKTVKPTVQSLPFKHSEKAQEIIDKLKSGQMKFIC